MRKFSLLIALAVISAFSTQAKTVVTERSKIEFMVGNMMIREVNGTIGGMTGTVEFDPNNLDSAKFEVCVDPATINTESEKRDKHLQSKEWFYVEKYPQICIKGIKVKKLKTGYMLFANLTMYGKTRQEEIPFTFKDNTFKGNLEIMRLKYRIGKGVSVRTVSDEVHLTITCKVK